MLVTCPNCSTRYNVPDMTMGAKGRTVRCAKCQHQWKQPFVAAQPEARAKKPEPKMVTDPPRPKKPEPVMVTEEREGAIEDDLLAAAMAEEARVGDEEMEGAEAGGGEGGANPFDRIAEMMMEQPPAPIPDMFATGAMDREPRRRRGGLGLVLVVLVILIAVAAAALIFLQDKVIARAPMTAKYYDMVGLRNEVVGAGLSFRDYSSERAKQDNQEVLIVRGVIANGTDQPRSIPLLQLALYDGQTLLQQKTIDPPQASLDGHGTVGFKITLETPDPHASRFEVTFVAGKPSNVAPTAKEGDAKPSETAPAAK